MKKTHKNYVSLYLISTYIAFFILVSVLILKRSFAINLLAPYLFVEFILIIIYRPYRGWVHNAGLILDKGTVTLFASMLLYRNVYGVS